MIMEARHNCIVYPFFKNYTRWIVKRNFSRVVISGTPGKKDLPVLLIANHAGWWDGFWAEYVNLKVFGKKFYFMMLEDQLRKYRFFNYCGGFSVRKNTRSVIESIIYSAGLLSDPVNIVLIFPQGKIESASKTTIRFEKGIGRILEKTDRQKIQIVFLVNLTDYFSEKKPALFQYLEEYDKDDTSYATLEHAYNSFYQRCLSAQSLKSE